MTLWFRMFARGDLISKKAEEMRQDFTAWLTMDDFGVKAQLDFLKIGDDRFLTEKEEINLEMVNEIRQWNFKDSFAKLDENGDGMLDMREMNDVLKTLTGDFNEKRIEARINKMNPKRDGNLTPELFEAGLKNMMKRNDVAQKIDTNAVKGWFATYSCFEMMGSMLDTVLINHATPYISERSLQQIHRELQPMLQDIGYNLEETMVRDQHNSCSYVWEL